MTTEKLNILAFVTQLEDPRSRYSPHSFIEIVMMTICAVICGQFEWDEIYEFCIEHEEWFKNKLKLKLENKIPSKFTFERVISSIDSNHFSRIFTEWIQATYPPKENKVIAIDGKSLLGSYPEHKGKNLIHLVNAIACDNGITLAQLTVADKENEIVAIPKLLDYLDIKGSIITMDAMGSQKNIAELIRSKNAHYVFAIKSNRKNFYISLEKLFKEALESETSFKQKRYSNKIDNHGRIEERTCVVVPALQLEAKQMEEVELWKDLKSVAMIGYTQTEKNTGVVKKETRFFISSLNPDAEKIAQSVREHWYIENKLHWILDVVYKEDDSRIRTGFAPHNLSAIKKLTLNLLKLDQTYQKSIKQKQRKALMNKGFLELLLGIKDV